MRYLILDTETGGVTPDKSLLQLYGAVYDGQLKKLDHIEMKIRPDDGEYKVTSGALEVNKINLVEHSKTAILQAQAKADLSQFLFINSEAGRSKLTVVGWNIHFDLGFIHEHLLSRPTWENFVSYRALDLQPVAAALKIAGRLPEKLGSLTSYAEHFKIDTEGAHDAKRDVEITLGVFRHLLAML